MAVNLSPYGGVGAQFLDNAGNVLTGGKIETYAAGTTVPQATYTSSTGVTFHPNPIILDASGRVPSGGEIWLTDGLLYKFVLRDSNNVLIATYDNISGINSNFVNFTSEQEIQTATAGQTVFNLTTVNYTPGTNSLSVFVDGVNQYGPGAQYAYLETNSTTVTFVNGLHVGASVKFTTAAALTGTATNANVVIYDPAGAGAVTTTVQTKLRETVSFKDFGAVGDGVVDDTVAIQNAINATVDGQWLDGGNATYKITTQINVANSIFRLRNAKFVFNTDYADQGQFELNAGSGTTAMTVELENIVVDGGRGTYKVGNEPWTVFANFNGYDSIVPALAPVFRVNAYNSSTYVRVQNVNFYNVHADSCIEIGTYGTVFIDDCEYKNISNKTFHVYHSPDNGVTQAGRTLVNNVYAQDVGMMPATFTVGGVAKVRADPYAPQGSFNFIVSHGDFTINNAIVWNYASCGVTADRNRSFNASNVFIYHDDGNAFSNNPSGAFFLEDCNTTNVTNLFVQVTDRDSRDTALDSSLLQIFTTANSQTNFTNVVLLTDPTVAQVRKIIRGAVKDNPSININNFYCYGLSTSTANTVSFAQLPNSVIGLDLNLTNGYIRHGSITIEQPLYASVENVTLFGDTAGGSILFDVSGNPGITGSVGHANITGCEIAGAITSSLNFTQSLKICENKRIVGTVSSAASSGNVQINDNAYIGGNISLSGASASSGIVNVMNNAFIGGTTTLVRGLNGRISGNNTQQRIEIKDVQTFEIVGNTAKTANAEPIIWVNPITAANILAGVISSNNVLIKTGTVGAGYVTIAGGVSGVTDVNNNKLTVAWT